jgi:hypothetical protein
LAQERDATKQTGRDVAAVDWDAYYPALSAHYRDEFS